MNVNTKTFPAKTILNHIQHYNHEKYWKMRAIVVNKYSHTPLLIKLYYLLRIKKMDAFNNASMGTDLNCGAIFETPPLLPHGLNGIIVHPLSKLGKNVVIHQQVTIAGDGDKAPIIGNNVTIGAGAKVLANAIIGDNSVIGANAVVTSEIPENSVAVGIPARKIKSITT